MSKKILSGVVTSNRMQKTITVSVHRKIQHPLYGKFIKKTTRYYAHDEQNQCCIGDLVTIELTRPLSKLKRYKLVSITKKEISGLV